MSEEVKWYLIDKVQWFKDYHVVKEYPFHHADGTVWKKAVTYFNILDVRFKHNQWDVPDYPNIERYFYSQQRGDYSSILITSDSLEDLMDKYRLLQL